MKFSLTNRPPTLVKSRKKTTVGLAFITQPFDVETQEGLMHIGPDTVDDWDGGYYVAYPDDDSKPYAIAPAFVKTNYEPV